MYCPRIDHFVRFNANGTIGKCGHMVDAPEFSSWGEMQSSHWLADIRAVMGNDSWPKECHRCQATEPNHSVRLDSIRKHSLLQSKSDYIILGGVLDNICNSACQSCNSHFSTKIGSLESTNYLRIENSSLFDKIPWDDVVEIDINGGEPTASPNYQKLLERLPENVHILRVNTNGSRLLPNIEHILNRGILVIITLSLDGTGQVHDYVRWPVKWSMYKDTVIKYRELASKYKNLRLQAWTTLHILNAGDFDNIQKYAQDQSLDHSWAYLEMPQPLDLRYSNDLSRRCRHMAPDYIATWDDNQDAVDAFIARQDLLRGIQIKDYL